MISLVIGWEDGKAGGWGLGVDGFVGGRVGVEMGFRRIEKEEKEESEIGGSRISPACF